MDSVARCIRRRDWFLRRRDLLALGYTDAHLREALGAGAIFRVRHGWYSVPDAPESGIRAVRVGGRLTGVAALESYGLRVPRRPYADIAVPGTACRLRRPGDRWRRLQRVDDVRIRWIDHPVRRQQSRWRVSLDDALLLVLATEGRDVAVACASAVMRYQGWSQRRLAAVFRRAPARARHWLALVSGQDDAHGETLTRLWYRDAGVRCESQPRVAGRRLDFRVGPNTYVEIDGEQHDPEWTGGVPSSWQRDRDTDVAVALRGGRVLRFTYRQLYTDWERCLAATRRAVADDIELTARRLRDPTTPRAVTTMVSAQQRRASRKRRRSARGGADTGVSPPQKG